jgi:protein involved in temperature-dependent protein secretion
MSLARINRIAAAVEAAGRAVIADPARPDLRDQLFHALAEVVAPCFTPADDQPAEVASLTRQARVWAQIVQERIVFAHRFSGTAAGRMASDSMGLAYNIRELLAVLDSIRHAAAATADD